MRSTTPLTIANKALVAVDLFGNNIAHLLSAFVRPAKGAIIAIESVSIPEKMLIDSASADTFRNR